MESTRPSTNTCELSDACKIKGCVGENGAQVYASWNELTAHCDEETILAAWNRLQVISDEYDVLARRAAEQREYHRKHQAKRKLIEKAALELLDPDELERIDRLAAEKASER